MAGEQLGFVSDSSGESLEAGRPAGDEGTDWVMVVGKGQFQGPPTVGPLCVGQALRTSHASVRHSPRNAACRASSPASLVFPLLLLFSLYM